MKATRSIPGAAAWSAPLLLALACAALLASCSSAPKRPPEVFEKRNQAADFVKLADSLVRQGQYDSALKYYRQALDANSSVDALDGVSAAHSSLGRLWAAWGDLETAGREFGLAADYARLSGSGKAASLAATGRGELAFRRGDAATALGFFDEALKAAGTDEGLRAIALHDRAGALYALGRAAEARTDLEASSTLNTKLKRWSEIGANRYLLASFLVKEDKLPEALAAAEEALLNDKKAENSPGVANDLLLLADLSTRLGKQEEAWWYWRRAFDAALGANLAPLARRAAAGLVAQAPLSGRDSELAYWKDALGKLESLGK